MQKGFHMSGASRHGLVLILVLITLCAMIFTSVSLAEARGERRSSTERPDRYAHTGHRENRVIESREERYEDVSPNDEEEDLEESVAIKKERTITLRELGILQLAAHDFFNVDRETEIDAENGKLDLSTLLDHGYDNIGIGGEPRNRENIILFSVAKEYGERYYKYESLGFSAEEAHKKLLRRYHMELTEIYEKLFDEDMPNGEAGEATMTENLALRTIHDFLPGTVTIRHREVPTISPDNVGEFLSKQDLRKESSLLDGKFDEEFLDVEIIIPPDTILNISLLERDSSFADQFNTDFSFEHFMEELEDGCYDKDDEVFKQIKSLFAKGMHFELE